MLSKEDNEDALEGLNTFFALPQKGLSIQYRVSGSLESFCDDLKNNQDVNDSYRELCKKYFSLERTSIDIAFDKVSGTFKIKH